MAADGTKLAQDWRIGGRSVLLTVPTHAASAVQFGLRAESQFAFVVGGNTAGIRTICFEKRRMKCSNYSETGKGKATTAGSWLL